jgi:RNA polymerase sigma-70 factor, ECF subfamily
MDELLNACVGGIEQAQKVLYKSYFSFGKSICMRYSNNREDAEEILNDSFMKVFKNLHKFDRSNAFKAWFRTILVNTSIDYYRRKDKLSYEYDDQHYEAEYHEPNAIEQMNAEDILAQVQKLAPSYRTVFLMYAVDGYSHKEIGDILNINEVTSRTNFLKARQKLQVLLSQSQKMALPKTNEQYEWAGIRKTQ